MRLKPYQRGLHDFHAGAARGDNPWPTSQPEGQAWAAGWQAALAQAADDDRAAPGDAPRVQPVGNAEVFLRPEPGTGRLVLIDALGRMLGDQVALHVEQQQEGTPLVSVTLANVPLRP